MKTWNISIHKYLNNCIQISQSLKYTSKHFSKLNVKKIRKLYQKEMSFIQPDEPKAGV